MLGWMKSLIVSMSCPVPAFINYSVRVSASLGCLVSWILHQQTLLTCHHKSIIPKTKMISLTFPLRIAVLFNVSVDEGLLTCCVVWRCFCVFTFWPFTSVLLFANPAGAFHQHEDEKGKNGPNIWSATLLSFQLWDEFSEWYATGSFRWKHPGTLWKDAGEWSDTLLFIFF